MWEIMLDLRTTYVKPVGFESTSFSLLKFSLQAFDRSVNLICPCGTDNAPHGRFAQPGCGTKKRTVTVSLLGSAATKADGDFTLDGMIRVCDSSLWKIEDAAQRVNFNFD